MTEVLAAAGEVKGGEEVTFFVLAPIAVLCAIGMVWARNAVHSALFLVVTMLCLGTFYVLQSAPFLGMVQIIVYTGAIMMLFLFVLMLVGRDASDSLIETLRGQRMAAVVLGIGFALLIGTGLARALGDAGNARGLAEANRGGNVQGIAALLFTKTLRDPIAATASALLMRPMWFASSVSTRSPCADLRVRWRAVSSTSEK